MRGRWRLGCGTKWRSTVSRQTHLPTAAESAVSGDEVQGDVGTRNRKTVLLAGQSGLKEDHWGEIDHPIVVLAKADLYSPLGRVDTGVQVARLLVCVDAYMLDDGAFGSDIREAAHDLAHDALSQLRKQGTNWLREGF